MMLSDLMPDASAEETMRLMRRLERIAEIMHTFGLIFKLCASETD